MENCKKYTNIDGAATTYRARPAGDCTNCAYFSAKNCGAHANPIQHSDFS